MEEMLNHTNRADGEFVAGQSAPITQGKDFAPAGFWFSSQPTLAGGLRLFIGFS
jgi:hypothetical protein